jgi:hypothetical protein
MILKLTCEPSDVTLKKVELIVLGAAGDVNILVSA